MSFAGNFNSLVVSNPAGNGTAVPAADFTALMALWFSSLPSVPQGGNPPQPWNNGGVLTFT
jgi:hypothetical protein